MQPARTALLLAVATLSACGSGGGGGGGSAPSALAYPTNPATYVQGFAIEDNVPSVEGLVQAWSIQPALPAGLSFDARTGAVSGTPLVAQAATDHVVSASNFAGSTTAVLSLTVLAPAPRALYVGSQGDGTVSSFHVGSLIHSGYAATSSGAGARALVASPDGAFVFAVNESTALVTTFAADPLTGRLSASGAPAATGSGPTAIAIDPTGAFLYVADGEDDAIRVFAVDAAGALSGGTTVSTGDAPAALLVDPTGRFLYAANAGSGDVELFAIDSASGALASGGAFVAGVEPRGLALAALPFGAFLYVADADGDAIHAFAVDAGTGALTELVRPSVTTGPGTGPRDLAVHPDGTFLYCANREADELGLFAIDPATGALSPLAQATVPAGEGPTALAIDPAGASLYVCHALDDEVRAYAVDDAGGLTLSERVRTRGAPADLVLGPAGKPFQAVSRHAYVTSGPPSNLVAQFAADAALATLTPLEPASVATSGPTPRAFALHPEGSLALASAETGTSISILAREPETGLLSLASSAAASNSFDLAFERSGRFAYASLRLAGIQPYAVDLETPDLVPLTLVSAGVDPRNLAADPTGRFVYAAETTTGVHAFRIDAASGELTPLGSVAGGGGTTDVEVHPSGRFAFATNVTGNSISAYAVELDGTLTALVPPAVATGADTAPAGMVFSHDGRHLYVTFAGTAQVAHYACDVEGGQLAFLGAQPTFVGEPRRLALDASGRFLCATNAASMGAVARYAIDPATGVLTGAGFSLAGEGGTSGSAFSFDVE